MSIRAEEKKRYFQETAIALRRGGIRIEPSIGGRLGVWLDDHRSISITTPSASSWAIPIGNAGSTGESIQRQRVGNASRDGLEQQRGGADRHNKAKTKNKNKSKRNAKRRKGEKND